MCNEVARRIALSQITEAFTEIRIPLVFPEGLPNLADVDSVRITDPTPIVRRTDDATELAVRRWSWRGTGGRPVYNYRSDEREIVRGRCLVPVSAFYEFTAPPAGAKLKSKWAFSHARTPWFMLGGVWRRDGDGEAFALLTCQPGPDVAPYHARQMVVVAREDWGAWLDGSAATSSVCRPLDEGTLVVQQIR